jgi:branched-chain amino acid transport system substrate-binding protein
MAPSGTAAGVFSKAVQCYKSGSFDSTIAIIRDFLKTWGKDPAAEYLVPLIMEALTRKGEFTSVNRLFDLYEKKYPSSTFMPRVYYLHGCALARERTFSGACESFSKALTEGVSDDLDSLIMKNVETICANESDAAALHAMGIATGNHPRIREIALYFEIRKFLASGETERAKTCFEEFRKEYPGSRFQIRAEDFTPPAPQKNRCAIGLLAPLSGDDADAGKRVSQGFRLAIDKYNSRHPFRIDVIPCDTRGSLSETVRKTSQLLDRDRVPVIVGPMLSPTATVAAGMLIGRDAVMLTPTATDDGIAELSPTVFQMNITLGVLARKLARYALNNLNIREFATVAPHNAYGISMAAIFKDEVMKNGGSVFDEEFIEEGGNDFTAQFVNLRRKLLLRRLDEAAKAAGGAGYSPVTAVTPADSAKWFDSTVSIGGIFMPADADDVVMLAPQVFFNRIKGQLLGSSGWHSAKTIADGKQYVQNAIISTPFEPDSTWKKWPDFRKEYLGRYHEEPDRVAALGFDAGTIVAAAIEYAAAGGGAGLPSRIAESIATVQKFEGASGIITFDRNNRTNTEAIILKITPNGFVRVQ